MKKPAQALDYVTLVSVRHPFRFLVAALILASVSVWLASGLEIRSSFAELLPTDVPSVAHIKELVRRVGGDGTVFVNIEALDGPSGIAAAETLAPVLAHDFLALGPDTIRSVEANVKDVEAFYQAHWPMFVSLADLEQSRDEIKRTFANDVLDLGLDDDASSAASAPVQSKWLDPNTPLPSQQVADRFARFRDGYFMHPDGASLALIVRPAGTSLGVSEAQALLDRMHQVVATHQSELTAHHLRVGFGGSFPMFIAEYSAIIHDIASTALVVASLILLSLFVFFRDVRSTVVLGLSVFVAVLVDFGITRLIIGYLNTQTAFLGSIVVGNGINYGLIYLARVRQLRLAGENLENACRDGARAAAEGTLLASAASSVSFAMLIIAGNRGFRHFGFIGGMGMLLCWLFTFLLVPAGMAIAERIHPMRARATAAPTVVNSPFLHRFFRRPFIVVVAFAAVALLGLGLFIRQIPTAIERNLENLTNQLTGYPELIRDHERGNRSMGRSSAGAIALLPSTDAAEKFCAVIRERQKEPRYAPVVDSCDTVSSVLPLQQPEKLAVMADIVKRLSDSVLERLKPAEQTRLKQIRSELTAQKPVAQSDVPSSLLDRFRERDGTIGRLAVITARPDALLEHAPRLGAFVDAVRNVPVDGQLYDASGDNVILADLLHNIEREGPLTTAGSLLGVCILVFVFFRRWRMSADVIASLLTGVILMAGVAAALQIKINFFNFIVFPITFGIAVDYGANVITRVRERGGNVLQALREVGPAVALCSWTSMIGYGSLLLAINRALRSFGYYALIGEATSITTALVMLPALALLTWRAAKV